MFAKADDTSAAGELYAQGLVLSVLIQRILAALGMCGCSELLLQGARACPCVFSVFLAAARGAKLCACRD